MSGSGSPEVVEAAGTLPWRLRDGTLEVALIHRPRYDDWSWPKGKLEEGEHWSVAAARETTEETGLHVRLGVPLPTSRYDVSGRPKVVRYWAATVVGGDGVLEHEVDDVAWCAPDEARRRLSRDDDAEQLDALEAAFGVGALDTRPFGVVRHAKARPRKKWKKPDWRRPLDARGTGEAADLVAVLGAYRFDRIVSSTSVRCVDTVKPYAKHSGAKFVTTKHLSEEGHAASAKRAVATLEREIVRDRTVALCSHGPVLPDLLAAVAARAEGQVRVALDEAVIGNLEKGEILVSHVVGGAEPRVVAVERHAPASD